MDRTIPFQDADETYQPLRVTDLERVFEGCGGDRNVSKPWRVELGHRSTSSAARLLVKVDDALASPSQGQGCRSGQSSRTGLMNDSGKPTPTRHPAVPRSHLGRTPVHARAPTVRDHPEDVLSAWTALEVLSPMTFKNPPTWRTGNREAHREPRRGHARATSRGEGGPRSNCSIRSSSARSAGRGDERNAVRLRRQAPGPSWHPGLAAIATLTLDKAVFPSRRARRRRSPASPGDAARLPGPGRPRTLAGRRDQVERGARPTRPPV